MKKFLSLFLLGSFILSLSSCNYDLYSGKRPGDYESAKWVSEQPSAYFLVDSNADNRDIMQGEILLNDQVIEVKLTFVLETNLVLFRTVTPIGENFQNGEMSGECTFSPDKLVIKIDKEKDTIFNGQYDELIFCKIVDDSIS